MITQFKGKYAFLSNFWPVQIRSVTIMFPSVEHAYQAAKTFNRWHQLKITRLTTGQAKRYGRKLEIREDWDQVKVHIMTSFIRQKFSEQPLRAWLQNTEPHTLIEGNNWGDKFWGQCNCEGKNHLGNILMNIRKENKPYRWCSNCGMTTYKDDICPTCELWWENNPPPGATQ